MFPYYNNSFAIDVILLMLFLMSQEEKFHRIFLLVQISFNDKLSLNYSIFPDKTICKEYIGLALMTTWIRTPNTIVY
jgi:hypothetical protein